jgi:hypothetical protein
MTELEMVRLKTKIKNGNRIVILLIKKMESKYDTSIRINNNNSVAIVIVYKISNNED